MFSVLTYINLNGASMGRVMLGKISRYPSGSALRAVVASTRTFSNYPAGTEVLRAVVSKIPGPLIALVAPETVSYGSHCSKDTRPSDQTYLLAHKLCPNDSFVFWLINCP